MDASEHDQDLELALHLADLADAIALRRFRATDLAVERKPDGSPVSDADKEIERVLADHISAMRPGDAILGEEGAASGSSARRWYLDPIDGTQRYVGEDPEWYTLIGLAIDGEPVVGVASAPALGERWWAARGAGAYRDGSQLRVSEVRSIASCTVADDWHERLARGITDHPLASLAAVCAQFRPHRGHHHLVIAAGGADIALGIGGATWDHAPTMVIVEEAGGRFTDLDGRRAFDSGHALVSNGRLHDQALRAIGAQGFAS